MTADQGTVHDLRPRLFPNFVVNPFFPQNNPVLFWVILFLLHMFMTESTNSHQSLLHSITSTLPSSLICSATLVLYTDCVTNFIRSYLHQFFNDSHGLKASLKPLRRPFNWCQSCLEAINIGWDIKQINW